MVNLLSIGKYGKIIKKLALTLSAVYFFIVLLGSFLLPKATDLEVTSFHHDKVATSSIAKIKRFMRRDRIVVPNRKQFYIKVILINLLAFQFLIGLTRRLFVLPPYRLVKCYRYNYLALKCLRL